MSNDLTNNTPDGLGKVALTHLTQLRDELATKATRAGERTDRSFAYRAGATEAYYDIVAHLNRDIRALMLDSLEQAKPVNHPIEDLCGDCGGIGSVEQFMGTGGKPVCGPCHGSGRVRRCA